MANRKVLLISYYFPPLGGAGISRPLSLFKHLPEHGIDCDVLTVKPVLYRAYEPELLEGLDETKIFRSGSRDPSRIMHILGLRKISSSRADQSQNVSRHFFPDSKAGWINPAVRMALKLCSRNDYNLIVSTSPPVSAHSISLKVIQSNKIPWVADFQDFWVLKKAEEHFQTEEHRLKARELLKEIKARAKTIVANNQSVADYVGADEVVHNSYESELAQLWKTESDSEKFVIGLFGSVSELNPVEPLLKLLTKLKETGSELYEKVKVLQVGQADPDWLDDQLEKYGHKEKFEFLGYCGRKEAVEILSRCSLFYFGLSPEIGDGVIPIRLYTMMSSGRPILAFAPEKSEVEKFLTQTGAGVSFIDSNFDNAFSFLVKQTKKQNSGDFRFTPNPEYVRRFSSFKMAENFAGLFKSLIKA